MSNFNAYNLSKYFAEKYHKKIYNNHLYLYDSDNGFYTSNEIDHMSFFIKEIPDILSYQRSELLSYLKLRNYETDDDLKIDEDYICFQNGLYNITTGKLEPHNPDIFVTNIIPHNYDNSYSEEVDELLDKLSNGDSAIKNQILESIGISISSKHFSRSFFIYGNDSYGREILLHLLRKILGICNYSQRKINMVTNYSFLFDKLINIWDIFPCSQRINTFFIDKIIKGEIFENHSGKFLFKNINLWFQIYKKPNLDGIDKSSDNKYTIIPIENTNIQSLLELSEKDCEYLIILALTALKNLLINKKYSESSRSLELKNILLKGATK